ncbi:hypothetical protein Gotri_006961, partial [Gossypium trilobum]|nr:hypothetical protein [Gossypium trilobum]
IVKASHQFDLYHNGSKVNLLKVGDQTHSEGTRVHLFTNGAMARNSGNAYAGGVVRDPGYKGATIQTDNLEVVKALTVMGSKDSSITLIIRIQRSSLQIFDIPPNDVLEALKQDNNV